VFACSGPSGVAALGTIGYEGRFDYAAIGTVSHVASRLCDEAKPGQILVSGLTTSSALVLVNPTSSTSLKGHVERPLRRSGSGEATAILVTLPDLFSWRENF
jgi:class 3 adenylate cyclase